MVTSKENHFKHLIRKYIVYPRWSRGDSTAYISQEIFLGKRQGVEFFLKAIQFDAEAGLAIRIAENIKGIQRSNLHYAKKDMKQHQKREKNHINPNLFAYLNPSTFI